MFGIEHISPSALETLGLCPQKFDKEYIKRLSVPGKPSAATFGTAAHHVMAQVGRGVPLQEARNEAVKLYLMDVPDKEYRNAEKLGLLLSHYVKRYGGFLKPVSTDVIERPVVITIEGIPVPLKFVLDTVSEVDVHDGRGPENWAVDYKTTSRLDLDWPLQYRNSNQFKAYDIGARQEFPDLNIAGVLVELFHVTRGLTSAKGQKGKTQAEIDGIHIYRLPIRYNDFTRDEWKKTVRGELNALKGFIEEGHFPLRAPVACKAFNTSCPFLDYCASENAAIREQILSLYDSKDEGGENEDGAES